MQLQLLRPPRSRFDAAVASVVAASAVEKHSPRHRLPRPLLLQHPLLLRCARRRRRRGAGTTAAAKASWCFCDDEAAFSPRSSSCLQHGGCDRGHGAATEATEGIGATAALNVIRQCCAECCRARWCCDVVVTVGASCSAATDAGRASAMLRRSCWPSGCYEVTPRWPQATGKVML